MCKHEGIIRESAGRFLAQLHNELADVEKELEFVGRNVARTFLLEQERGRLVGAIERRCPECGVAD